MFMFEGMFNIEQTAIDKFITELEDKNNEAQKIVREYCFDDTEMPADVEELMYNYIGDDKEKVKCSGLDMKDLYINKVTLYGNIIYELKRELKDRSEKITGKLKRDIKETCERLSLIHPMTARTKLAMAEVIKNDIKDFDNIMCKKIDIMVEEAVIKCVRTKIEQLKEQLKFRDNSAEGTYRYYKYITNFVTEDRYIKDFIGRVIDEKSIIEELYYRPQMYMVNYSDKGTTDNLLYNLLEDRVEFYDYNDEMLRRCVTGG